MLLLENVVWPDGLCEVMCREMRGRLLGRVSREEVILWRWIQLWYFSVGL